MPGFDRTGPAGAGPMTGRGLGGCGGARGTATSAVRPYPGRSAGARTGIGRGVGRGRGRGAGAGRGRGRR